MSSESVHGPAVITRFTDRDRIVPGRATTAAGVSTMLLASPRGHITEQVHDQLIAVGVRQIVLATSTYEVEHLIAAEVTGDFALVSLGFGSATNRIVGLLRPLWNRITLVTEGPTTEEHLAAGIRAGATGVLHHRQRRRVDAHLATVLGADLDIIDLIAQGCGNKEIALRLSIPEMQVKGRLGRLSRRIGIGDRAGLVAVAYRMGLIGDTTQAPSPLTPR